MNIEPLKGKLQNEDVMHQTGKEFFTSFWLGEDNTFFYRQDVKSAVEWLKKELFPFYKGAFSKTEIWRMSNDEICDKLEDFTNKKINEAFEDVSKKRTKEE